MMTDDLTCASLFREPDSSLALRFLARYRYPWEILSDIPDILRTIAQTLPADLYDEIQPGVFVPRSATVARSALLSAPGIIGEGAEIRHCAFIRGAALVGRRAVVGNSVELKNCILFDRAQVPHFNYVGDSILGFRAHMGAGAVTSNVKSDKSDITVSCQGIKTETGCRKFGAALGDGVEVGCHCVLNPGTVIGPNSRIYPLSSVRGYVPADSIFKDPDHIVKIL